MHAPSQSTAKYFRFSLLLMLPLGLGAACGDDGGDGAGNGGGAEINSACSRGCDIVETLSCVNDPPDCEAECITEYEGFPPSCRDEALAFANCSAQRPASDYECDEDGLSTTRDGVCEAEANATVACILGTG